MKKFPKYLAGRLLVARPELTDPNFNHSIVFISRHDANGALGFVMNRLTGQSVLDVIDHSSLPLTEKEMLKRVPVLIGGPVSEDKLSVIVFTLSKDGKRIRTLLNIPNSRLREYLDRKDAWVRAFRGYSGWAPGQLENELKEGVWEVRRASDYIFDARVVGGLWPFLLNNDERWLPLLPFLPKHVWAN